jgi:hypothetical protein
MLGGREGEGFVHKKKAFLHSPIDNKAPLMRASRSWRENSKDAAARQTKFNPPTTIGDALYVEEHFLQIIPPIAR